MGVIVEESLLVTPGDVLGKASQIKAGKGTYYNNNNNYNDEDDTVVYASLTGLTSFIPPPPHSIDKRPTVEVTGHKAHCAVPQPGSVVIARVTKVMVRTASADILCVGPKSVREKFTGIIRNIIPYLLGSSIHRMLTFPVLSFVIVLLTSWQQDVRATEIDKVEMHSSFRPGDIVKAVVLSLGDARAYHLSTAKNELGVVSAESASGATMVPISWTEMQCPLTSQTEPRKVAKAET